ncbi:MAG TPA: hypothetical protein VGO22_15720 [Pseudorhizobium sp.]|jgi:2-oxo-4-hydroxy-4-carboxy--5-ureidoimidazoline (OHCU) decarboxylase|nr:hypothetical protein [Pseudorhizobium sp.]
MQTTNHDLVRAVDRAIRNSTVASQSAHPQVPVKLVAAQTLTATSALPDQYPEVLHLVCQRAVELGYVVTFGE